MADEQHRSNDIVIAAVSQKLDDFIGRFERFDVALKDRWILVDSKEAICRRDVDMRLAEVEKFVGKVRGPAQYIGWAVMIIMGTVLTWFGSRIIVWVQVHWH